jgi:hypothetical protein
VGEAASRVYIIKIRFEPSRGRVDASLMMIFLSIRSTRLLLSITPRSSPPLIKPFSSFVCFFFVLDDRDDLMNKRRNDTGRISTFFLRVAETFLLCPSFAVPHPAPCASFFDPRFSRGLINPFLLRLDHCLWTAWVVLGRRHPRFARSV